MKIQIRCENVIGFDESTQQNIICDQALQINSEHIGKKLVCPRCRQEIKSADENPFAKNRVNSARPQNVMDLEFESTPTFSTLAKENARRCEKCGGQFAESGKCTSCGFAEPVQKAKRDAKLRKSYKPAGLQLWLMSMVREEASVNSILYSTFFSASLLLFVTMIGGILSTTFFGVLISVVAAGLMLFLILSFLKINQLMKDHVVDLGILRPVWNTILAVARFMNWKGYDPNLKDRIVIDRRSQPVTDEELAFLPQLEKCQVIDLENSPITDSGIQSLIGKRNIQCLVLRKSKVSIEAAVLLQQSNPRMWIWL